MGCKAGVTFQKRAWNLFFFGDSSDDEWTQSRNMMNRVRSHICIDW
jgi:hypothetical protein